MEPMVYYLKTSAPGRIIRIRRGAWYDEPEVDLIEGEVDEDFAFSNTLKRRIMNRARSLVKAHGYRLREPHRMFLYAKE